MGANKIPHTLFTEDQKCSYVVECSTKKFTTKVCLSLGRLFAVIRRNQSFSFSHRSSLTASAVVIIIFSLHRRQQASQRRTSTTIAHSFDLWTLHLHIQGLHFGTPQLRSRGIS